MSSILIVGIKLDSLAIAMIARFLGQALLFLYLRQQHLFVACDELSSVSFSSLSDWGLGLGRLLLYVGEPRLSLEGIGTLFRRLPQSPPRRVYKC